jgi:DNA-binding MarR family transcriptional regulator
MTKSKNGGLDTSVLHLLHRAGQQAEELFVTNSSDDTLTPRQFAILVCVESNEDISQTGLVEQTGIDRSTLADVVRRLVTKGFLQRKRTRRDARMYAVRLTSKGRAALEMSRPAADKADEAILSTLKSGQRKQFIELLQVVVEALAKPATAEQPEVVKLDKADKEKIEKVS